MVKEKLAEHLGEPLSERDVATLAALAGHTGQDSTALRMITQWASDIRLKNAILELALKGEIVPVYHEDKNRVHFAVAGEGIREVVLSSVEELLDDEER